MSCSRIRPTDPGLGLFGRSSSRAEVIATPRRKPAFFRRLSRGRAHGPCGSVAFHFQPVFVLIDILTFIVLGRAISITMAWAFAVKAAIVYCREWAGLSSTFSICVSPVSIRVRPQLSGAGLWGAPSGWLSTLTLRL